MPQVVVVTGGAGAIGSRVVQRALEHGANRVEIVDDLSSGYAWLIPNDDRVHINVADVCSIGQIELLARDAVIFHLAAFFANQNSVDHPVKDLQTNGLGTLETLQWAVATGARRVVYASAGCSIAGHGTAGPIEETMPVSLELDTPYQITKALGEFYCNYFADQVSTVRCRFFNSYGPGEVPGRYRNVIPNFIWAALHDAPLTITGTGHETRDFIFVDDLVDGLIRCALTPAAHRGAFNLGTGIETSVYELATSVIDVCGSRSEIVYAPRRPWDHSVRRQASIARARATLEFRPSVALRTGLERTVDWFRKNYDAIDLAVGSGR